MKKLIFLLTALMLTLFTQQAMASHAMGGELTYVSLGNNSYRVTLNLYRDCSGIPAPTDAYIKYYSDTGTVYQTSFIRTSSTEITSNCQGPTTCQGGTITGFQQYVYSGVITLPTPENYTVSYSLCCRNTPVTNLTTPDGYNYYLTTNIDNSLSPSNNSPTFSQMPAILLASNNSVTLSFGTIDIDGDSISYEMVQPLHDSVTPIPYLQGFSIDSPLVSATPFLFDTLTGDVTFTPIGQQNAVISVLVKEHRFGQVITTTRRDLQYVIVNPQNQRPTLSTYNTNSTTNSFSVCVGDTLDFGIVATDPDTGQTMSVTVSPSAHTNIRNNNTSIVSVDYNWAPTINDVSAQPYVFTVEVQDHSCPPSIVTEHYYVYVNPCRSDVWPGDANSDLVANNYDILNIGRAWNHTGPARTGATTNWVGQPAVDWPAYFLSGLNQKYADCNGDGTVDSLDLDVITLNYGQTHLKSNERSMVGVPISITSPVDTFVYGETVNLSVMLGTTDEPANDVYGVAFTIDYNEIVFDANSLSIDFSNNSWFDQGNGGTISYFKHDEVNGTIDIAITRTNQRNVSGMGELMNLDLKLKDDLTLAFIQNTITVRGTRLEDFETHSFDVSEHDAEVVIVSEEYIGSPTGINEIDVQLGVYPNPANSSITVSTNVQLNDLTIYNLAGQKLQSFQAPYIPQQIDIENLENGVYLISGQTTNGKRTYTRFVKMGSNK